MELKKNSIVRKIGTNEIFEVIRVTGIIVLCSPIKNNTAQSIEVPLVRSQLELIMEEETEAFNVLFRDDK